MNTVYLKELQYYSQEELMMKFQLTPENFKEFSQHLSDKKVFVKKDTFYQVNFVGFISYKNKLAFAFPKYLNAQNDQIIKQFIQLFKEYSNRENLDAEDFETFGDVRNENVFNFISMAIFFLEDYGNSGLYMEEVNTTELDGEGEINWNQTVDNLYPVHMRNQSIYLNFYTERVDSDVEHVITRIHKYVLNECFSYFKKTGLSYYFDYFLDPFDILVEDIGNSDFMLGQIRNELSIQYNDRKIQLLKLLHAFLSKDSSFENENSLTLFGTKSFHVVWEKVCSFSFNNLYKQISEQEVIDHPVWEDTNSKKFPSDRTLTPDIITTYKENSNTFMLILDAKYYDIKFESKKIKSAPHLEDVTKQYLYELALKEYMQQSGYKMYLNAFLFPYEGNHVINIGKVSMTIFKNLSLKDIQLYKLPASKMYEYYIKRKTLSEIEICNFLEIN